MSKPLVAYFSTGGSTEKLAKSLAKEIGADVHVITPAKPYSKADLDWTDKQSRSSIEMADKSSRPEIRGHVAGMDQYDTVFVGFPIWWYVAPTIVNTFLEQYDLTGKTVVPFATSGSSGMGETNAALAPSCPGATLKDGKRFAADATAEELKTWAEAFVR